MNEIISAEEFKERIKRGLSGGYLFFGDEEYLKRRYLESAREAILGEDTDVGLNHRKVSCLDFSIEKITDALITTSVGFFSEGKKFSEFHEINFNELKEESFKELIEVISSVDTDTVFIIYTTPAELSIGNLPKSPSKDLKRLSEYLTPVNFKKESDIKLMKWTARHFAAEKLSFENGVCELMVDRSGRDMYVLSNEIEKVSSYVKYIGEGTVTKAYVNEICSTNLEINAFDFSNAILEANTDKAYLILSDMKRRKEKPTYILNEVLGVISDLYTVKLLLDSGENEWSISKKTGMHEYRVGIYKKSAMKRNILRLKKLLALCCEADIKLKSTSLDDYSVLDKLVILASVK